MATRCQIRAADLPLETVVARGSQIWIKQASSVTGLGHCWTGATFATDAYMDDVLASGGVILRYGDGTQTIGERGQVATVETGSGITVTVYRSAYRPGGITVEVDADDDGTDLVVVNVNDDPVYPARPE